jgi:uncharacterized protein (TIGR02452 family)
MLRRWEETRSAFEQGWYLYEGDRVDLSELLARMRAGTRMYLPKEQRRMTAPAGRHRTAIEVTGQSTLEAARRVESPSRPGAERHVAALNFASARTPGGGVMKGSQAQEEDLARASALWLALSQCPEFYAFHRQQRDPLYSDRLIYAPRVPVFRADDGAWLPAPVPVSFLTSAAPNRRVLERDRPADLPRPPQVLADRVRGMLAVAAHRQVTHLVLGAWGCGVFGNDPAMVAGVFRDQLRGEFAGVFRHVVFAVLDPAGHTRRVFADTFAD